MVVRILNVKRNVSDTPLSRSELIGVECYRLFGVVQPNGAVDGIARVARR